MLHITKISTALILGSLLAACHPKEASKETGNKEHSTASAAGSSANASAARPQPVTTVLSRIDTVPIVLSAQGNVLSLDEVDIRPQKTGMISKIHFTEGDEVKRGQLLFSLDDREDQANVKKAEATLAGTQSQIVIAQRELTRNTDLFNQKFVSSATVDTSRSKLETLQSTLDQNKAALDQARAVLSYSSIRAPFNGRAGRIDVRPGSLVLANTTISLVKITRMDPIGVSFNLAERDLVRLRAAQRNGPVSVQVDVPGQRDEAVKGKVVFIESTVDKVSGTIGVKAEIDNAQRKLWPGQYVTVRVNAGQINDALVLPPQAIVNGPNNRFVYIVKPDMTVAQQPIELVRIAGRNAIVTGIEPNQKVVLEGASNLRPGSTVVEVPAGGRNGKGGKAEQSAPASESAPQAGEKNGAKAAGSTQ
ncbi:efflux RND transporter periplasmic adaptor subunit [Uliginosibacterium sediminicola]|uniref:Efflux RND transporter periplasmic adaptor subunit n=1 Tax=Uliginosibacterium sediminicola TaxID=2024550 RepID=A0ABU9YU69_9RHOO